MLILIIWGLSVICSVLPLVGWSQFVSEVSKLPFTSKYFIRKVLNWNNNYFSWILWLFEFLFQAYFMGCTFDCYSTTFNSRSYAITLLVIAWIVPLIFILTAYIRIIQYVRKSTVQNVSTMDMTCVQWGLQIPHFQMNDENEFSACEDHKCLPHIRQRVWLQQFLPLYNMCYFY